MSIFHQPHTDIDQTPCHPLHNFCYKFHPPISTGDFLVMNEYRVTTASGNVRATYLRFRLGDKLDESDQFTDDEDDDVDDGTENDDNKTPILNSVVVDLSNQHLSCFNMEQIPNLQLIKYLHLQNNDLTSLPSDLLLTTPVLQWLDVRNNRLRCLPIFKHHTG